MRLINDELLTAAVTLDGDYSSQATYLGSSTMYAIQLVFTGTPNGAFKLQGSNDVGDPNNPVEASRDDSITNWTDIPSTSTNVTAAGTLLFNQSPAAYRWVRVVYTFSSSTGSLTSIRVNIKGV